MMTGIVLAGVGVGTMVMPPAASWLIHNYGWRTSYIAVGVVALLFVVLAAQFLRRDPYQMGKLPHGKDEADNEMEAESPADSRLSLSGAIHTRQFWLLCGTFFGFFFCLQTVMVHTVIHATGLGISPSSAASILAIIGGLSIAGRIVMGSAGDRIGNKPALTISLVLMSLTLFWLTVAKEIWMLYLFAGIFGFGYGGLSALLSPLVAEVFGLRSHGAILGVATFIATIGGAIGPVAAGHIFDVGGSYQPAFLLCGTISVLAIILALLLRPIIVERH